MVTDNFILRLLETMSVIFVSWPQPRPPSPTPYFYYKTFTDNNRIYMVTIPLTSVPQTTCYKQSAVCPYVHNPTSPHHQTTPSNPHIIPQTKYFIFNNYQACNCQ